MITMTFQQSIYHSNDTARGTPMAKYPGIPCIVGIMIQNTSLRSGKFCLNHQHCLHTSYVTGYSKTDHNVTLGQLQFIGPANSYTHTLSMYCCIKGLS